MPNHYPLLRHEAQSIWEAGVAAVQSDQLVGNCVRTDGSQLIVAGEVLPLDTIGQIAIVGAGKAGAGMAEGLESALGSRLMTEKNLHGWVNVPADCVRPLERIHLHPARPPGCNEPTQAAIYGTEKILEIVQSLTTRDLCIALISGGGSALLVAPMPGITLEDKVRITRHLSAAGASIEQLNTVRRQLSLVKGGGLARACRAGCLVTLVISDVMSDPLHIIASGPSVVPDQDDQQQAADQAVRILRDFGVTDDRIIDVVRQRGAPRADRSPHPTLTTRIVNRVIGNNDTAVTAAAREAKRRGWSVTICPPEPPSAEADDVGQQWMQLLWESRNQPHRYCVIGGGEPVVRLAPADQRGSGGRNQQLVLAGLVAGLELASHDPKHPDTTALNSLLLLSGGTDGEDGPTDAAGAVVDHHVLECMRRLKLDPRPFLQRNDAYHFFAQTEGLITTGPTHTNVGDLRVGLVATLV